MSDLCSLAEEGGRGGGGGAAASFSPFSWREKVVIHIIRAVLCCAALHYLVFNDPIYGQHLGYVLTHSPVHYAHHPVEFP